MLIAHNNIIILIAGMGEWTELYIDLSYCSVNPFTFVSGDGRAHSPSIL